MSKNDALSLDAKRWQRFVDFFGLTKPGVQPWDAPLLDQNAKGSSPGELYVIQFLLHVWDPHHPWQCGRFDLHQSLRVWGTGSAQQQAVSAWVSNPYWP